MEIRKKLIQILLINISFLLIACSERDLLNDNIDIGFEDIPKETEESTDIVFWNYKSPPEFRTEFLREFENELNVSVWHTSTTKKNKPTGGELGAFGIGNGKIFGFVGLVYPLNTLHSLCGPYYEKKDRFFGDFAIEFFNGDNLVEAESEYVLRSLSAPINIIIESFPDFYSEIMDITPLPIPEDDILKRNYIRIITIKNTADKRDLSLILRAANSQKLSDDILIEEKENAILSTFFLTDYNSERILQSERFGIRLKGLQKDEERTIALVHHISNKTADIKSEVEYIKRRLIIKDIISSTIKNYREWENNTTKIETPDIAVNHLIRGLKLTLKTQIADSGAAAPMSEYTRVWTRDISGWIFGLLSIGAFEDVKKILMYLHYAINKEGDIENSYPADLNPEISITEPDWENMPPLKGKASAEGPSYIPIYHHLYYENTGDRTLFDRHKKLIKRALVAQNISDKGLIPFSGDETYRAAMNAAFGLPLEFPHHEKSYSPNSSILFIRAAKGILNLYEKTDSSQDAYDIKEKLNLVENAFYNNFILPNGCISAFIDIETRSPYLSPFEDESLTLSFMGNEYYNNDFLYKSFLCLLDKIHIKEGVLLSQINDKYKDFLGIKVRRGILTGMLPGYTLKAFNEFYHQEAEAAFNQMGKYADTSGNYGEYLIFDNRNTLSLIYDANGKQGDYTARFRPWEGGLNLHSIVDYLTGFRIYKSENTMIIRPHLPNGWNFIKVNNLKFNSNSISFTLKKDGDKYNLTIDSLSKITYKILIIIDIPEGVDFYTDSNIKHTVVNHPFQQYSIIFEIDNYDSNTVDINYNIHKGKL